MLQKARFQMTGQQVPRPWGGVCLLENESQPVCPKGSGQGTNSRKAGSREGAVGARHRGLC